MHINDVERAIGVSKKNIRFYEEKGLLTPRRETGNGYRTYSEDDVARLARIKLLRKLDMPLALIGDMLEGRVSLSQGVQKHTADLQERQRSLESTLSICTALAEESGTLNDFDALSRLEMLSAMEQQGVRFADGQKNDKQKKYHGAILAAMIFIALMATAATLLSLTLLASGLPRPVLVVSIGVPLALSIGAGFALRQRMEEIARGDEDDYRDY